MRKRRALSIILILITAALLISAAFNIITALSFNRARIEPYIQAGGERRFKQSDTANPYRAGTPVEEIDIYSFLKQPILQGSGLDGQMVGVVLEEPVYYYAEPSEKSEIVYTIPAGARILMYEQSPSMYEVIGKDVAGIRPTYERGWRYSVPFRLENAAASSDYYYVKTETLIDVAMQMYNQHPDVMRSHIRNGNEMDDKNSALVYVLYTDYIMYQSGAYRTADLYMNPLDARNIVLLILSGISIVLVWVYRRGVIYF